MGDGHKHIISRTKGNSNTVMILSFRTDLPEQTVQTQIRLLLIRVYTVCHSVCIVWTHYSMVEPHSSNFRVITTNFLSVRIFRKFTVKPKLLLNHYVPMIFSHINYSLSSFGFLRFNTTAVSPIFWKFLCTRPHFSYQSLN